MNKTRGRLAAIFLTATTFSSFASSQQFPGGLIEKSTSVPNRPPLTAAQIQAFMPASRGKFTFPAPYNTTGIRLTVSSDCPGSTDCVQYTGYSYWSTMNYHVNSSTMLILVGLDRNKGGAGPSLLS